MEALLAERFLPFAAAGELQIDAGTEATAGPSEEKNADTVILGDYVQALVEFAHHHIGNAIESVRAVKGDGGEDPVHIVLDGFIVVQGSVSFEGFYHFCLDFEIY